MTEHTELSIEEKVVLAGALRMEAMFLTVATDTRPLGTKTQRLITLMRIATANGIETRPVPTSTGVEFVVPGYTPPPTVIAEDLEPGMRIRLRNQHEVDVAEVETTSGGITYVNKSTRRVSLFASDPVEIVEVS